MIPKTVVTYKNRKFIVSFPEGRKPRIMERVLKNPGHAFLEAWVNIPRFGYTQKGEAGPLYSKVIELAKKQMEAKNVKNSGTTTET